MLWLFVWVIAHCVSVVVCVVMAHCVLVVVCVLVIAHVMVVCVGDGSLCVGGCLW